MAQFKNIHLLTNIGDKDKEMIEHAAREHNRHSGILFKALEVTDKKVVIQAVQGKTATGIYFDKKRLVEIVNETFGRFFPGIKINVQPIPFTESPATKVDVAWINKQMLANGTKLKDIANETGLNYTYLSNLVNGGETLTQLIKALFWYYFLSKK
jgi:hypothetical protein